MKRRIALTILISMMLSGLIRADEGMFIPLFLEKYNISDMQEKGFRLNADDIYNINGSSLKDAVVIFNRGCTGEVVSDRGLVFTNHHCGYNFIQSHSSIERDLLSNGFWAMSLEEELPNKEISVTFLKRIEDVSERVLEGTEEALTENERQRMIRENIRLISKDEVSGEFEEAVIKPFYYGNEYYMFVYEKFPDVRLVGAPPESIGNFGKDYDNWIWPRHTGDFSVFRIYADKNNRPAKYSPDNVPYKPRKFLPVSLEGFEEGDFTMLMGYPANTNQYYTSTAVKMLVEISYPKKIELRTTRLEIMDKYMSRDEVIRIQYAAKYRRVSNAWKKWQGIIEGIRKVNAVERKSEEEEKFQQWLGTNEEYYDRYGAVLQELNENYSELSGYILLNDYYEEAIMTPEINELLIKFKNFLEGNIRKSAGDKLNSKIKFLSEIDEFFKDYNINLDAEIYESMLIAYLGDIDQDFHPEILNILETRYKSDVRKFIQKNYKISGFTNKDKLHEMLENYPENEGKLLVGLENDPLYLLLSGFRTIYREKVYPEYTRINRSINELYRIYVEALLLMNKDGSMYPDANFTMRITYGEIEGYEPRDAVIYDFRTTLSGVIDKYETGIADYTIPERLITLYNNQDYGPYADKDGSLYVCFIASNHTSGGNSGSPVLNAEGQLIGLNFDRNWEGTMSDLFYDKSLCRNITVDIRYILFIIDKFSGAGYLVDELEIIGADRTVSAEMSAGPVYD